MSTCNYLTKNGQQRALLAKEWKVRCAAEIAATDARSQNEWKII